MRPLLLTLLLASFACRDQIPDDEDPKVVDTVDTTVDTDLGIDGDGDGYTEDEDCDDTQAGINPGAAEIPYNGIDDDCDPTTVDDDLDGDGFAAGEDCDDANAEINPGASEACNGLDDNCSGAIDDAVGDIWYTDADGDGFGDAASEVQSCDGGTNLVADASDCDDVRADINPDADEVCDGADQDCDGAIDNAPVDGTIWYADADGDGFGDGAVTTQQCEAPAGFLADAGDCDDTRSATNPGAPELCNAVDDNCDGTADNDATDAPVWYADTDGDGFGDSDTSVAACDVPTGFVSDTSDCDDADSAINPAALEICDGLDNDCDQLTDDDGAADTTPWYADVDGDGFGDDTDVTASCLPPDGTVAIAGDCDDAIPTIYPSATELCDGLDNDCNGAIDEVPGLEATWYRDADMDGFGDDNDTQLACAQPDGYVAGPGDCDDSSGFVRPGAEEFCDGVDQDCDGDIDESAVDASAWYADADADGHGAGVAVLQCDAPAGHVELSDDCDDDASTVFPGADELCNSLDDDCDGTADNDPVDPATWWADADADGYGDVDSTLEACERPAGYTDDSTDCDDTDATIRPDATELCDAADRDCDGDAIAGATDGSTWYADADADNWGDVQSTLTACAMPDGYVDQPGDCNDADQAISPVADEICDGLDNDCNGGLDDNAIDVSTFYADTDADGYGALASSLVACQAPAGFVPDATDCDDGAADINPAAPELCDTLDRNCDGDTEAGAADAGTVYADVDGDGFGGPTPSQACEVEPGFSATGDDCDDNDLAINPDADELCDDVDRNCDGDATLGATDTQTSWADTDGDGQGDVSSPLDTCALPDGRVLNADDCDDAASDVFLGADELCDDIDHNCDGDATAGAIDPATWYTDADADGFGTDTSTLACDMPAGFAAVADDCDDANQAINPSAPEVCNELDDNCDGSVDNDPSDGITWYEDADLDGSGNPAVSALACERPESNWTEDDSDCDDTQALVEPGADEICDGLDNNCDGAIDEDCADVIAIGPPAHEPPASIAAPGACAQLAEVNSSVDPHVIGNMETFMAYLDDLQAGKVAETNLTADTLDFSVRCNGNNTASQGNYSPTTPWPTLPATGTRGASRFRGYIHIEPGADLTRTIGLIGNDALRLVINDEVIIEQNWRDGRWKKFRWVAFEGPGLYPFEVQWSTNFVCDIDPMEVVWSETWIPGFATYDTMCASANCGAYGDGTPIFDLLPLTGEELVRTAEGTAGTCTPCASTLDCGTGETCGAARLCE